MPGLEMIKPLLTYARVSTRFRQLFRNDHLVLSVLAIVVGAVVGISVVGFREAIDFFQGVFYGSDSIYGNESEHLAPIAVNLPGWRIILATTLGGRVRGGFYGEQPPLEQLRSENLEHRVDFREMYAAVARDWWGLNAAFLPNKALSVII